MAQESNMQAQRCGVIGMGMIGAGVAACLVRKGRSVSGYDVRPEAVAAIQGVTACTSPAELARNSDVVIVSVVSAEQAQAVLFGPQGVAEGVHPELVVALMSTIRLPIVHEFAKMATEKGFKLIDVAITTGGAPTSSGTAALMAGGDEETIESVRSVMEDFSVLYTHMGPLGAGMAAKVARNIMHYCAVLGAYEGGLLAEAAGVDLKKLIEVVRKSDPHNVMSTILLDIRGVKPLQGLPGEEMEKIRGTMKQYFKDMALPENLMDMYRGLAKLLYKDLDAGIDLAHTLGVDVPGAELALDNCDQIYGLPPGTTEPSPLPTADEDAKSRGLKMMDAVYGKGTVPMPPVTAELPPYIDATVKTIFGDLWSRPGLSVRDRRLLVLGATGQMSRPDLIEIQVTGALKNKELSEEELQEMVLTLAYYCGWGNGAAVFQGVSAAIKKAAGT